MEPGTSWPAPRQSRPGSPSSLETDTRQGLKTEGETAASLGCPAPTHSLGNKTSAEGSLLASCRRPPARGCGGWFSRSRIRVTLSHSAVGGSARINTVFSVGHLSRYLNITRASEGRTPLYPQAEVSLLLSGGLPLPQQPSNRLQPCAEVRVALGPLAAPGERGHRAAQPGLAGWHQGGAAHSPKQLCALRFWEQVSPVAVA